MSAEEEATRTGAFEPLASVGVVHGRDSSAAAAAASAAAAVVKEEDTDTGADPSPSAGNTNANLSGPPSPGRHGAYAFPFPPPPPGTYGGMMPMPLLPPGGAPSAGPRGPPPPPGFYPHPAAAGYGPPPPPGWQPPPGWAPPPGWHMPPPPPPHHHPTSPGGAAAASSAGGGPPAPGYGYWHWGAPNPYMDAAADENPSAGSLSSGKKRTKKRSGNKNDPGYEADKKARKNEQSRARAARLRERIADIEKKPIDARTEDDLKILEVYEERRRKKNERSRDRAIEKKGEIKNIMDKPEKSRTKAEQNKLDAFLRARQRKNEGDRMRRECIKKMGLQVSKKGVSVSIRGGPRRLLSPDGQPIPIDPSIPYDPSMSMESNVAFTGHHGGMELVSPMPQRAYASTPPGGGDAPWMPSPPQESQPQVPTLKGDSNVAGSESE